jgi:hypothetical protein
MRLLALSIALLVCGAMARQGPALDAWRWMSLSSSLSQSAARRPSDPQSAPSSCSPVGWVGIVRTGTHFPNNLAQLQPVLEALQSLGECPRAVAPTPPLAHEACADEASELSGAGTLLLRELEEHVQTQQFEKLTNAGTEELKSLGSMLASELESLLSAGISNGRQLVVSFADRMAARESAEAFVEGVMRHLVPAIREHAAAVGLGRGLGGLPPSHMDLIDPEAAAAAQFLRSQSGPPRIVQVLDESCIQARLPVDQSALFIQQHWQSTSAPDSCPRWQRCSGVEVGTCSPTAHWRSLGQQAAERAMRNASMDLEQLQDGVVKHLFRRGASVLRRVSLGHASQALWDACLDSSLRRGVPIHTLTDLLAHSSLCRALLLGEVSGAMETPITALLASPSVRSRLNAISVIVAAREAGELYRTGAVTAQGEGVPALFCGLVRWMLGAANIAAGQDDDAAGDATAAGQDVTVVIDATAPDPDTPAAPLRPQASSLILNAAPLAWRASVPNARKSAAGAAFLERIAYGDTPSPDGSQGTEPTHPDEAPVLIDDGSTLEGVSQTPDGVPIIRDINAAMQRARDHPDWAASLVDTFGDCRAVFQGSALRLAIRHNVQVRSSTDSPRPSRLTTLTVESAASQHVGINRVGGRGPVATLRVADHRTLLGLLPAVGLVNASTGALAQSFAVALGLVESSTRLWHLPSTVSLVPQGNATGLQGVLGKILPFAANLQLLVLQCGEQQSSSLELRWNGKRVAWPVESCPAPTAKEPSPPCPLSFVLNHLQRNVWPQLGAGECSRSEWESMCGGAPACN